MVGILQFGDLGDVKCEFAVYMGVYGVWVYVVYGYIGIGICDVW